MGGIAVYAVLVLIAVISLALYIQLKVQRELTDYDFNKLRADSQAKIRAWAVDANYNLYGAEGSPLYVAKVRAALQDVTHQI
jgi:hypothetical protein